MIIGIDGNEANVNKKVGIGEYAYRLLIEFYKTEQKNTDFIIYLKNNPQKDLPKERRNWKYRVIKPRNLWTQFALPANLYLRKVRPDVFFSLTHYAPRFSPIPTIISVMDLSYVHYSYMFKRSDLYQLKRWTSYSVRNSKRIITISRSSKNDIINYYKLDSKKVSVVYPGIKEENTNIQAMNYNNTTRLKEKYNIRNKYILFVGTLQPRKNIIRLIEAFGKTLSKFPDKKLELVIVGMEGWLYEDILQAPKKNNIEKEVKFLNFVEEDDLPLLYRQAICFVLPSLYEGFGLPILEAMKYGCPVLTSNVSSLPEAGGDAALYFDPYNIDDMAGKIEEVLKDEKLRKQMKEKGFDQVKRFSWKKSAAETINIIKDVVYSKK